MAKVTADKQQDSSKKVPGRPFKKGQSGNPAGRKPNQKMYTEVLREIAGEECKSQSQQIAKLKAFFGIEKPVTWAQLQVYAAHYGALVSAMKGQPGLMSMIVDRVDGKIMQPLELSGDLENPLIIRYVDDWRERAQVHHGGKTG